MECFQMETHIDNITSKANRTFELTKRNLNRCSQEVKPKAYIILVKSTLEYSSIVFDPYLKSMLDKPNNKTSNAELPNFV